MSDPVITLDRLTKIYGPHRGIENVSFTVDEGEVLGFIGPNGAGKTTAIRCLLGFANADSGSCSIRGMDCRRQAPAIQRFLGYLPGEIAFPDGMTGRQFLKFLSQLRGTKTAARQQELEELLEIDLSGRIKRYSKGMKQKVGIIAAFMHDPQVLILDEPTSGLDPLMQNRFTELIISEKKRGKTILMSSHMFEEVERTCDRVVIIKDAQVVQEGDMQSLRPNRRKIFLIQLARPEEAARLAELDAQVVQLSPDRFQISLPGEQTGALLRLLAQLDVAAMETKEQSLEDIFLHLYDRENDDELDTV